MISTKIFRGTFMAVLALASLSLFFVPNSLAQRRAEVSQSRRTMPVPLPAIAPLPANVDPFAALEGESVAGRSSVLKLSPTTLDPKVKATAEVSLRGQTLLVRMRAQNIPPPSVFGVPRYALWVYVPNYQVKFYIGDLPITLTSKRRGESDSAYRFNALPPNAVFGGLMLTAEPVRYTPIVNEALRPLLVALTPEENLARAAAAATVYAASSTYADNIGGKGAAKVTPARITAAPRRTPAGSGNRKRAKPRRNANKKPRS